MKGEKSKALCHSLDLRTDMLLHNEWVKPRCPPFPLDHSICRLDAAIEHIIAFHLGTIETLQNRVDKLNYAFDAAEKMKTSFHSNLKATQETNEALRRVLVLIRQHMTQLLEDGRAPSGTHDMVAAIEGVLPGDLIPQGVTITGSTMAENSAFGAHLRGEKR